MKNQNALKNQALYWRGFAYLAVHGERTLEDWNAAQFSSSIQPPSDDDVAEILEEAGKLLNSKGKAADLVAR